MTVDDPLDFLSVLGDCLKDALDNRLKAEGVLTVETQISAHRIRDQCVYCFEVQSAVVAEIDGEKDREIFTHTKMIDEQLFAIRDDVELVEEIGRGVLEAFTGMIRDWLLRKKKKEPKKKKEGEGKKPEERVQTMKDVLTRGE